MTAAALVPSFPFVQCLGWALVHFVWQGAIVALLLACALGVLPSRARLRYAASCAALALMVALPVLTFAGLAARSQHTATQPAASATAIRPTLWTGDSGASPQPWMARWAAAINQVLPSVTGFWLAGVILFLCRLNLGLVGTVRLRSPGTEPAAVAMQRVVQSLRVRLGIERAVRLVQSTRVQTPTVVGWLRPAILIPIGCMMGLSEGQVEAILAHELAHIRRHDYLISLFQALVETLLFYHPAVWWVSSQVRREREHCCDDVAVAISGDRVGYAKALSFLAERRGSPQVGAFAANGGILKMRIARLLGVNRPSLFPRAAAITLLALAGSAAGVASLAPGLSRPGQSPKATGSKRSSVDQKWLNQDVRWIITPEEREAYQRLNNDTERDAFIRQFWKRRNPTPGSAVNVYRQEHYRRIAYANLHFGFRGEPGWEGDRGHVYIVFGPPDAIRSEPSGSHESTRPMEIWEYRSIRIEDSPGRGEGDSGAIRKDVEFRFEDDCGCGDFRLRSPWPSGDAAQDPAPTATGAVDGSQVRAVAATARAERGAPDLSCTYYDAQTVGFAGTCGTRQGHEGHFYCRKNSEPRLFQEQIGCKWKIDRARSLQQEVPEIPGL